jgi:peptidyl-prolyl cis-trans isomerase B (cyclophilin B)
MRALVLLAMLLALAAGCGGDDNGSETTDTTGTTTDTTTAAECEDVDAPDAREPETRQAPTEPLAEGRQYSLVFETSCGSFTVALNLELAPNTAASLVALAEDGYFDDTIMHRVVPGFVVQGGDPTQSGGGGPGYSTVDVPPSDAKYINSVVAMAKSPAEAPGTAGSQFFVVTGADVGLTPDYAIVGEVTEGMDALSRMDALGVGDAPPSRPIVVTSVTVSES